MDPSQDWCFFEKVAEKNSQHMSVVDYNISLIDVCESKALVFVARGQQLSIIRAGFILEFFGEDVSLVVQLQGIITFVAVDQIGNSLAVALGNILMVFNLDNVLAQKRNEKVNEFDEQIRLIQWFQDILGVLLVSNELVFFVGGQMTRKSSEVSYFAFIDESLLIIASNETLQIVSFPSFEKIKEVVSKPYTFGLAYFKNQIFQFLVEDRDTLNLNIFSQDLQFQYSIVMADSFPFAPHKSLEDTLPLTIVSKFYFFPQRNTFLMTSTCIPSVLVFSFGDEFDMVNFEENIQGEFKFGWLGGAENTCRGFGVIRISDNAKETYEYMVKDTTYNIAQPPLILAVDSAGTLSLRRFIDLRKDYLNNQVCISLNELKTTRFEKRNQNSLLDEESKGLASGGNHGKESRVPETEALNKFNTSAIRANLNEISVGIDPSEDWCFFERVSSKDLDHPTFQDYAVSLISVSEKLGYVFIAQERNLHIHKAHLIEEYCVNNPQTIVALESAINFVAADLIGASLAISCGNTLTIFTLSEILQGRRTEKKINFNAQIRLLEWYEDLLGVLLITGELIVIQNTITMSKKYGVSYFSFIDKSHLIIAFEDRLNVVSFPALEKINEVVSKPYTFGLAYFKNQIFQFLVEDRYTLNLNIFSRELQFQYSIDMADSFPFAPHKSLEDTLPLTIVSKFYFFPQRNTFLMTSTCIPSVVVFAFRDEFNIVNFEENIQGEFKFGWLGGAENTCRGFGVIRISDKPKEKYEYMVKDTTYNIAQPPFVLAVDSASILIVKRFIDLRKDFINDELCISVIGGISNVELNRIPKLEEEKQLKFEPVKSSLEALKKIDVSGSLFSVSQKEASKSSESFFRPQESSSMLQASVNPSNPFTSVLSNPFKSQSVSTSQSVLSGPGQKLGASSIKVEKPLSTQIEKPASIQVEKPTSLSAKIETSEQPVTLAGSLIREMNSMMQSLLSSLEKSSKMIESMQVDYSKSNQLIEGIEKKCEIIVNKSIHFTEHVKCLQEKTANLEDKSEFIKSNSENLRLNDDEDFDERLFDDYKKLAESINIHQNYFDIAVNPICLHHSMIKDSINPETVKNSIDFIKKTKTFQPKTAKPILEPAVINKIVNESAGKLERDVRKLQGKLESAFKNFESQKTTVYRFDFNSDDDD